MTDEKVIVKQAGAGNVAAWTAFGMAALTLAKQLGWVGNQFDGFVPAGASHGGHFGGGFSHFAEENINLKLEVNQLKNEKYTDDKYNHQDRRLDWLTWQVHQLNGGANNSSAQTTLPQATAA